MTVPGIDTLSGSPAASSRRAARRSAEPVLQPHPELPCTHGWPLRSYRELRALPVSVRSARLQARKALREWCLEALADPVELLVSEITTNAVRASAGLADPPRMTGRARRAPRVRFWLTSNQESVLIQVWDGGCCQPVMRQDAGLDAEDGRGLLLVETLSAQWGCYAPAGPAWAARPDWAGRSSGPCALSELRLCCAEPPPRPAQRGALLKRTGSNPAQVPRPEGRPSGVPGHLARQGSR